MDPLTAGLNLATAIIALYSKIVDGMTPEQRQQFAQGMLDDAKAWRQWLDSLKPTRSAG